MVSRLANIREIYQYSFLKKSNQHIIQPARDLIKKNLGVDVIENPQIQVSDYLIKKAISKFNIDENEQNIIEDWAANCFQILLFNLVNPEQKKIIYDQFGLDWKQVLDELHEIITDDDRRERMRESTDIFRVLVKTLFKAGIITDRTKDFYSVYVDLDELKEEGDRMVGDDIADEGLQFLKEINFRDNTSRNIAAE